ncbi:MAG TPA: hypothetical protein VFB80_01745 [Pirellulaceae bacterium]|nr:hypothetical protein [Pirellulaceae bacterium]
MKVGEFDYRNAKAVLQATVPEHLQEIYSILQRPEHNLDLMKGQQQR